VAVLDQEIVQRIATLRLRARRAVEGVRSGIHRSPHRGASVIFAEHRDYRPGDDLRLLDWRAYARSDRYTIKHFEQETHLRAHLLFDVSGSMRYGGETAPGSGTHPGALGKLDYAATLLSAMAFILLGQADAVGVHTLGEGVIDSLQPRARPGQLDAILRALAAPPDSDGPTHLHAALEQCAERAGRRALIVLASDLLDFEPSALEPLTRMHAAGHDVIVFHVLHPDELDFPFEARSRFVDPESDEMLDTDPEAVREAYMDRMGHFLIDSRKRCTAAGARYALARTDVPVQQVISAVLSGGTVRTWA
jgi:uncharacterized protein (DUF58 family)